MLEMNRTTHRIAPLAEQGRIVAKVDELMQQCDALEAALVQGETVKGKLLEAVLQEGPKLSLVRV